MNFTQIASANLQRGVARVAQKETLLTGGSAGKEELRIADGRWQWTKEELRGHWLCSFLLMFFIGAPGGGLELNRRLLKQPLCFCSGVRLD
jgi:hypothetical protein